jgi:hypothetical protein
MAKTPKPPALTLVGPETTGPKPPRHLGQHGMALWTAITGEYRVDDSGGIEMLMQACLAVDRVEALAEQISRDGEVIRARGGVRSHPALKDEVALRSFIVRTVKALGLNFEPARSAPGRPPGGY